MTETMPKYKTTMERRIDEVIDGFNELKAELTAHAKRLEIENAELTRQVTVLRGKGMGPSAHVRQVDPTLVGRHAVAHAVLRDHMPDADAGLTVSGRVTVSLETFEALVSAMAATSIE